MNSLPNARKTLDKFAADGTMDLTPTPAEFANLSNFYGRAIDDWKHRILSERLNRQAKSDALDSMLVLHAAKVEIDLYLGRINKS